MIKNLKIVTIPTIQDTPISSKVLAPIIPPLSIAAMTTYLRSQGYSVDQDDLNIKLHHDLYNKRNRINLEIFFDKERIFSFIEGKNDKYLEKVLNIIISKSTWQGFDVFLFSCPSTNNITCPLFYTSISYMLRKRYPRKPFICGGQIYRFASDDFYIFLKENNLVDFLIEGPGEKSLIELLQSIENNQALHSIPGLYHLDGDKVIRNPPREVQVPERPDFDGLPMELYKHECEPKYSLKLLRERKNFLILPYIISNGCPYKCAFCCSKTLSKFVYKPADEVVDDIIYLKKKHDTRYFYFLEATFNFSPKYVSDLCARLCEKNVNILWSCCVHPAHLSRDLLSLMKRSGAVRLIYGFETGSKRMQKFIKKDIDLDNFSQTLAQSHSLGIWNGVEVICGLPHERNEDIQDTIDFLNDNSKYIDEFYFNSFRMPAYSSFIEEPENFQLSNIIKQGIHTGYESSKRYPGKGIDHYSFDEVGGLPWEKKQKQIVQSYNKVIRSVSYRALPLYENIAYLFYFYDNLDSKDQIKTIHRRYSRILMRKAFFRFPRFVKTELSKSRNPKYFFNRFKYFLGI